MCLRQMIRVGRGTTHNIGCFVMMAIFSRGESRFQQAFVPNTARASGFRDQSRVNYEHIEFIGERHSAGELPIWAFRQFVVRAAASGQDGFE